MLTFVSGREGAKPFLLTRGVEHMAAVGGVAELGSQEPAIAPLCADTGAGNYRTGQPHCCCCPEKDTQNTMHCQVKH